MTDLLFTILFRTALALAFLGTPYMLARTLAPRLDALATLTLAALVSLILNAAVPLALHGASVPISAASLTTLHFFLALLLFVGLRLQRLRLRIAPFTFPLSLLLTIGAFALLVLPFTHLAGIDTYKWQDLASNVIVEGRIPWLSHPLALFGYVSPRSYPGLHPLVLASAELLEGGGIEWGFFTVSLVGGTLGALAIHRLALALTTSPRGASWAMVFYVFSPVFIRYNHWATGRGFFMALLPLFLLALTRLPRPRAWLAAIGLALLLPFAHKTGIIAVMLSPLILFLSLLFNLRQRISRPLAGAGLLAGLILGAGIVSPRLFPSPAGLLAGFVIEPVVRFGAIIPFAAAGALLCLRSLDQRRSRFALAGFVITLPLAFFQMYGAMLALPFLVVAAGLGMDWALATTQPRTGRLFPVGVMAIVLAAAVTIVVQRSLDATPVAVWRAARFLEARDPAGPYQIIAPDRLRTRIQAYVSGCPRFPSQPGPRPSIRWTPPPPLAGSVRTVLASQVDWLRRMFTGDTGAFQWYGNVKTRYNLAVDGQGNVPAGIEPIYSRDGIDIYEVPVSRPPEMNKP